MSEKVQTKVSYLDASRKTAGMQDITKEMQGAAAAWIVEELRPQASPQKNPAENDPLHERGIPIHRTESFTDLCSKRSIVFLVPGISMMMSSYCT